MNSKTLRVASAAATVCALIFAAGCTSEADTPVETETTPTMQRSAINLKVGALLPMSGSQQSQGESTLAALQLAANDVNEANLGVKIELIVSDSGGPASDIAAEGATELIEQGVSAIIGPRTSAQVLQTYELTSAAKVVQISPSATLPTLSELDSNGYFFRTAPSDTLQAAQLARRILFDGAASVDIIEINDSYSTAITDQVVATLEDAGAEVVRHTVTSGSLSSAAAAEVIASHRDAILVVSGASDFPAIIDSLAANNVDWNDVYGTDATIEVLRGDLDSPQIEGALFSAAGVLADRDLQQAMLAINPDVRVFAFAPEAYDALIVIALAALQAQSADGSKIRNHIVDVSGPDGVVAYSFAEAAGAINNGERVDYSGVSGPIDFAENGDLTGAFISFYRYGPRNSVNWLDQKFWQFR